MCAGSVRRSGVLSELGRGGVLPGGALRAGPQVLCAALGSCSVRRPVRWLWSVRGNWERWGRACCALRGSDAMCGRCWDSAAGAGAGRLELWCALGARVSVFRSVGGGRQIPEERLQTRLGRSRARGRR